MRALNEGVTGTKVVVKTTTAATNAATTNLVGGLSDIGNAVYSPFLGETNEITQGSSRPMEILGEASEVTQANSPTVESMNPIASAPDANQT